MRIETILNDCQKFKSFIYEKVSWSTLDSGEKCLKVLVKPRKNGKLVCSCCQKLVKKHDQLSVREFEFVPILGYRFFFVYQMRRVNCRNCGVKVELVPWASGKHTLTNTYMKFLADWAKNFHGKKRHAWRGLNSYRCQLSPATTRTHPQSHQKEIKLQPLAGSMQ